MKIKAVFADFDGTLLRSDGTVSERTIATVQEYVRRGGKFFINTGRVGASIVPIAREMGLHGHVAGCQGGVVYSIDSAELEWSTPIESSLADDVLNWLEDRAVYYQIYPDTGGYFTEKRTAYTDFYEKACGTPANIVGRSVREHVKDVGLRLAKMLVVLENEEVEEFRRAITERFGNKVATSLSRVSPAFFEINNPNSSKGNALKKIAEIYGIDTKDCVAFGDQGNDISMLVAAGTGVAVANATADVKQIADYVTLSCDEDGVADYIEKFCLGDVE